MEFNRRQLACCIFFIILLICEFILGIWWANELLQYGQVRDDPVGTFGAGVLSAVAFGVLFIEELVVWICAHYLLREKANITRRKTILSVSLLTVNALLITYEVYKVISLGL